MIRPLRRAHRAVFVALALALPLLLLAALRERPDPPLAAVLPEAVVGPPLLTAGLGDWVALAGDAAVRARLDGAGRRLVLEPSGEPAPPDLLVYWRAGTEPPAAEADPPGIFLGSFPGRRPRAYELPAGAARDPGHLVLYSLGHRRVAAWAATDPTPREEG